MTATFYDVLGVPSDASQGEIRAAYRERVKQYHPDVSDHDEAEARFRVIVRAEEVLGDPDERARYDRLGHDAYHRVVGATDPGGPTTDDVADWVAADWADGPTRDADDGQRREHDASRTATGRPNEGTASAAGDRAAESSDDDRGATSARDGARATRDGTSTAGDGSGARNESAADQESAATWEQRWRDAWKPGTGEDIWRQEVDPAQRSYTIGGGDGDGSGEPESAGVASAVERERRRRQPVDDGGADIWEVEIDEPVAPTGGGFARQIRSRDVAVLSTALLVIYPVFVYFSVTPSLSLALNFLVGVATLVIAMLLLTEPAVSLVVFGAWSVLSPLVLVFLGFPLLSLTGLVVLAAFWIPLGFAGLLLAAVPQ